MSAGVNEVFKEVKRGDPPLADEWNRITSQLNRLSQFCDGFPSMSIGSGTYPIQTRGDEIWVANTGAEGTIPTYGIMLRKGVSADSVPVPTVKRPDTYGCQQNFFINGGIPILANQYGTVQLGYGNLYIAAYDSSLGTPGFGDMWGPGSGSYILKPSYGGFIVEGIWDSTNHYALVRSVPMMTVRGKPTADVAGGASGTINVYVGAYGSEVQPTGNPQITGIRNDSDCTIKGSKISRAMANPDTNVSGGLWQFVDGRIL